MRAYTVAVAASALDVDRKWLDNVLTQHRVPGVHHARQGVSRMITPQAIVAIAVSIALTRALGAPIATALAVAARLLDRGEHELTGEVTVRVDIEAIERRLAVRLADAVDAHPPARRGRPPRELGEGAART